MTFSPKLYSKITLLCTSSHYNSYYGHISGEPMYNFVYSSLQSVYIMQFATANICIFEFFNGHFLQNDTVKSQGSLCRPTSSQYNNKTRHQTRHL